MTREAVCKDNPLLDLPLPTLEMYDLKEGVRI
jgi:hypothetical protein